MQGFLVLIFNCILFQDIDGLVGSELGSLATVSVTSRSADLVRTATASLQASLREILASNTKVLKPDHPALATSFAWPNFEDYFTCRCRTHIVFKIFKGNFSFT